MNTTQLLRYARLSTLSLGLLVASCTQNANDEIEETEVNIITEGPIVKRYFGEELLEGVDLGDGTYKIYGDVIVDENQFTENAIKSRVDLEPDAQVENKLALLGGVRKWTNNTMVYRLENLNSFVRDELFKSMKVWEDNTNIRFKEYTGSEANYVTIRSNGDNCNCGSANLGMNGSRGVMNLGTRTSAVVIIHEIGHNLGYIHEQTRSDRDQHVKILFENIQNGAESQFRKNTNSDNLGEFDILSTMMYGNFTFSKNGKPTITRLDGSSYPRRQAKLSAGDIANTNQAYPGSTVDPDPDKDICAGIAEWVRGRRYQVGDKVTYRGFLFERDFSQWNRLGQCGVVEEIQDPCEGVDAFNSNRTYNPGDQVTYRGFIYIKLNRGWRQEGQCL
ncbi:M12 family metallopeptidase [Aquimarina sp. ERC-38]|uniref:M12 family metallopeptidase n=1 Tax=Aquimarina sp. ERC-38 TaxID=2949996 RepID=UPI002245D46F|nr:M12 family metallopeptidase [Aquimarina sp. ERC-38]UZO80844.1 M12 family metallopeptidase [Aquimarina sp. ERC-38]